MMKKLLSFFVALFATCALWAGNVITYTASEKLVEADGMYDHGLHIDAFNVSIASHTFNNGTGTITFSGNVTSIGDRAFFMCDLTSIIIPNSVTSIEERAFSGCSGLTSVTIPNSVTSIGEGAFQNCSGLTSITIPNSVTSIGYEAFLGCSSLTSVTIGNSVTSIGGFAFSWCSLTSISIPNSVTSIGSYAFEKCYGLTSVHIADISAWCGITFGGYGANPLEYAEHLYIEGSEVTDLIIPNSVMRVGDWAFYGCSSLTSVTIGNSVTSIGREAFYNCSGLTSITIPSSVASIGEDAFRYCEKLKTVYNASSLNITKGNHDYGDVAYYADKIYKGIPVGDFLILNDTITLYIGQGGDVIIPETITSIGDNAFYKCYDLTSVTIPNSVTSIGDYAFFGCSGLTSVTIGNFVTSIGREAFYNCSGLTSITIPSSVTSIGEDAFRYCKNLKTVFNTSSLDITAGESRYGSVAYYADKVYKGIPVGDFIILNDTILYGYIGQEVDIIIPETITSIGDKAFYECYDLTSVTIPNSVTSIGDYAFYWCYGLTSITIPNSVTSIGERAFEKCSGLTSITIPNSVTSIGKGAFQDCYRLTSFTIPNSVTSIEEDAFSWSGLTSITIPESVTSIGDYAFNRCSDLTSITIPNSVTSIGEWAFMNCTGLTSIAIPNSVTSIGAAAFYYCTSLTSVTIGNSVMSIGDKAFYCCSGLRSITCEAMTPPSCEGDCFYNVYKSIPVNVPNGSVEAYRNATGWRDFFYESKDLPYAESFSKSLGDFTIYTVEPEHLQGIQYIRIWQFDSKYGMKASAYYDDINHRSESWLISPRLAFPANSTIELTFDHTYRYTDTPATDLTLFVSEDYNGGEPSSATWTQIAIPTYPSGSNWTFVNAGTIDLSSFAGKNVTLAFRYKSTDLTAATWEIKNVQINSTNNNYGDITTRTITYNASQMLEETSRIENTGLHTQSFNAAIICHMFRNGQGTIIFNRELTNIGYAAFYGCSNLTSISIPSSVTNIEDYAFYKCSSLPIENDIRYVGNYLVEAAFKSQNTYTIKEGTKWIGSAAFAECPNLTSITIPNSVTSIGVYAFYACPSLTSVNIGKSVEIIGTKAFDECAKLRAINCYAPEPPLVYQNGIVNFNAHVYVPCDNLEDYIYDTFWGYFRNIDCIAAEESNVTSTIVTPSMTDATFAWPITNGAASYTLIVTKNGEEVCTLTFNARGQLMNIAFAPSRNGAAHAPSAELTATGYQFTVTGLESGSTYAYTLVVKDVENNTIESYSGNFTTEGLTELESVISDVNVQKLLRDGHLFIRRDGKTYNMQGAQVE